MLQPVSQHQTLMARTSVVQATLMAFLSRRRVLQGDGAVHAYRVTDWQPGEIPQRDAQAHAANCFSPNCPAAEAS